MLPSDKPLYSTDCFRMPDLKSSLNEVHLKIPHALKETSYLTDKWNMAGSRRMATTIGNYLFNPVTIGLVLSKAKGQDWP